MSGPQIQCGVAEVGGGGALTKSVAVSFPETFTETPVVVANALRGRDYPGLFPDTFAVSVATVSMAGATLRVRRVDGGSHWSQNLELCWLAVA